VVTKTWNEIIGAISSSNDHLAFARNDGSIIDGDVHRVGIDLCLVFGV
jgi:hypothetical protein